MLKRLRKLESGIYESYHNPAPVVKGFPVYIIELTEVRWPECGKIERNDFTFI